jgi:hypothetical protein
MYAAERTGDMRQSPPTVFIVHSAFAGCKHHVLAAVLASVHHD